MSFLSFKKKRKVQAPPADTGLVQKARKTGKRSSPMPLEVKLLAMEALESGMSPQEVGDLLGVHSSTINNWRVAYASGGVQGLSRKASCKAVRYQCSVLEEKIIIHRQTHPDRGVRRIRDDLRREEGLAVSAEKVRTTVNEAGLGNTPPKPHRRPAQIRRFEKVCPNAMWQIDIFTFQLKRMYPVYLVGIIDDHSRYITGWGLFRRQTADAVLEVTKGAIGQWGAPREILSDNGRQFVAWRGHSRFQKVLKQQGIGHVRSAPQHPMTLGKIERFWKTIWNEFLFEASFSSFADACQRMDHWFQYYNHQRPHQGIDGASPADRFYGLAEDTEEAVKQGCEENALRLALGQQPKQPLYLLGQLGGASVRVVRKGDDIEVKVGDAVHEVIRMGAPFTIREDGGFGRDNQTLGVEGAVGSGAVSGGDAGPSGEGGSEDALQELRGEPTDVVPGDGSVGPGFNGSAGTEDPGSEADPGIGNGGAGAEPIEQRPAEGAGALEGEVYGGEDLYRPGASTGPEDFLEWPRRKKTPDPAEEEEMTSYDESYGPREQNEDGP